MNIELRHLRYFVAVAEEMHFGRAAERLNMSQPPLSHAIRQLETELRAELFIRTTRTMEITAAGTLLLDRTRSILADADSAVADVRRVAAGKLSRLNIGFTGSATYDLLPAVAHSFGVHLPGVELKLHGEMLTSDQVDGLRSGSLDLAFLRPPVRDHDLEVHVLRYEPLIAVLPSAHTLARLETIPLERMRGESFISYPDNYRSAVYNSVLEVCSRAGFHPKTVFEVQETSTLVSFVAAGLGVALVPASVRQLQVAGAVYRPLQGRPETVGLAVAYRPGKRSQLLRKALQVIVNRHRELPMGGHENCPDVVSPNLHPSGFDELMPTTLAASNIDRLLHHAHCD